MQLSIVLPCFNEAENLEAVVDDVTSWLDDRRIEGQVVVVDDGSRDDTAVVLERLRSAEGRLVAVSHGENQGYGAAVRSGCDRSRREWIGFMDCDGQFRARDFDRLLLHTEHHPLIVGRRIRRADPALRSLNMKLYSLLVGLTLGVWVADLNCAMKLFRHDVWQQLRPIHGSGALFNAELFFNARRAGLGWATVPVHHYPRAAGHPSGADPRVILRMFRELVALKRSTSRR